MRRWKTRWSESRDSFESAADKRLPALFIANYQAGACRRAERVHVRLRDGVIPAWGGTASQTQESPGPPEVDSGETELFQRLYPQLLRTVRAVFRHTAYGCGQSRPVILRISAWWRRQTTGTE